MNGEDWTVQELARIFLDFRDREFKAFREEMAEEIRWLRRLLIGTLVSAVVASIGSSIYVVVKGLV